MQDVCGQHWPVSRLILVFYDHYLRWPRCSPCPSAASADKKVLRCSPAPPRPSASPFLPSHLASLPQPRRGASRSQTGCRLPVEKPPTHELRCLSKSRLPHQQRHRRIRCQNLDSAAHETSWHALVPIWRKGHACSPRPSPQRPLARNLQMPSLTQEPGMHPKPRTIASN